MRNRIRFIALAGAALLALVAAGFGCATGGGTVQRGINCYNAANYPCAAAIFRELESGGYRLNAKGRVRYLAYSGLTYFRMGQLDAARRYLVEAHAVYRSGNPRWLPPGAVAQMNQALAQLSSGTTPQQPPAQAPTPTTEEPTYIQ
jgi:hypothetical protein